MSTYRSLPVYPRLGLTIIWGFLWLYIYMLRCHYFLGSSNLRHIRFVIFVTCLEQQLQEHTQYNRTSGETCLEMDLSSPCRAFLGKALRKRYWLDTLIQNVLSLVQLRIRMFIGCVYLYNIHSRLLACVNI